MEGLSYQLKSKSMFFIPTPTTNKQIIKQTKLFTKIQRIMSKTHLQLKRALRAALFVLLLCVAGMTKSLAQNITFADDNVKAICVANWDTDGDGELSYAEAAVVTDLGEVFKRKSSITSFNELQYFMGLTSLGYQVFAWCTSLVSITIPNSVTNIGYNAFFDCWSLVSVNIPYSVTSISTAAFEMCSSINQIIVDAENPVYDSRENCNAIIETTTNKLILGCQNTIFPSSVTIINGGSFRGCLGLTSVTIPSTIDSITGNPFTSCYNLEEIIVNTNNVAFDSRGDCNALASL